MAVSWLWFWVEPGWWKSWSVVTPIWMVRIPPLPNILPGSSIKFLRSIWGTAERTAVFIGKYEKMAIKRLKREHTAGVKSVFYLRRSCIFLFTSIEKSAVNPLPRSRAPWVLKYSGQLFFWSPWFSNRGPLWQQPRWLSKTYFNFEMLKFQNQHFSGVMDPGWGRPGPNVIFKCWLKF